MKKLVITIKTPYGFEKLLEEELNELGYENIKLLNRAVQLRGNWEDVYRLNYHTRLAISVLVEVKSFTIHNEKDLYKQAKKIDWTSYFDLNKTFAVKGAVFSTLFQHSQYPLLVVKDAIADTFREQYGKRPDVNIKAPQVMFDIYIKDKSVVVSLNTSGVPLFQRGYRQETGEAPINEVLAAGLLRLSGWDRKSTLIDPMCGSGTIAIEAALWAANIPAMIERRHYAFKNFTSFDAEAWEKVQNEGNKRPVNLGFDILASDIDGEMVQKAKRNSKVAPIGNMISFERKDALTLERPDDKGVLICNPPYEERMGEDVEELYEDLGNTFKNTFVGYNCWIISSNIDALKNVGLKPSKKIKVYNGSLECSFRQYQIFEGSRKDKVMMELDPSEKRDVSTEKQDKKRPNKKEKDDLAASEKKKPLPDTKEEKTVPKSAKYGRQKENKYKEEPSKKYGNREVEETETPPSKASEKEVSPTKKSSNPEKRTSKYQKNPAHLKYGSFSEKDEEKEHPDEEESSEKKEKNSYKDKIDKFKKGRE